MDQKNNLAERAYQQQNDLKQDQAPQDIHRDVNLKAEMIVRQHRGGETDPKRTRVTTLLVKAQGALVMASEGRGAFCDVRDLADEVLGLDPLNARAFTLRALAYAKLNVFDQAVEDAASAIALDPKAGSEFGVSVSDLLQVWRDKLWWQRMLGRA
jgi:tetratricopeptide (TPR) repeat protein